MSIVPVQPEEPSKTPLERLIEIGHELAAIDAAISHLDVAARNDSFATSKDGDVADKWAMYDSKAWRLLDSRRTELRRMLLES